MIVPAKTKVIQAALLEVFEGQAGDISVIGLNPRDARNLPGGADVHARQVAIEHLCGDRGVLDPRDDAVAVPPAQPAGGLAAAAFVQVNVPVLVLADVGADAVEQAAGVFVGGLDDESNAFSPAASGGRSGGRRFRIPR